MNRRTFLGLVPAVLAGATLDPERLLWVPGAKTIFLPTVNHYSDAQVLMSAPDILAVLKYTYAPVIRDLVTQDSVIWRVLAEKQLVPVPRRN